MTENGRITTDTDNVFITTQTETGIKENLDITKIILCD